MQLIFIIIGKCSDTQLKLAINHLTILRKVNPSINIDFVTGINDTIKKRLCKEQHVKYLYVNEFINYNINNSSNAVN